MGRNYRAELTGVFGDPVDGNPTGVMEEAGYEALGLNYRYITMKVTKEGFPDAMKAVRALNMRGVNLTMPHKITVLPWLDELSQAAAIIGPSIPWSSGRMGRCLVRIPTERALWRRWGAPGSPRKAGM